MAKHSFKIYRSVIVDQFKDVEIEAADVDEAHDKMVDALAEHAENNDGWIDNPESKEVVDYGTLDEVEEDDLDEDVAAPAPVVPAPAPAPAPVVPAPAPAPVVPAAPVEPAKEPEKAPPKKSWW